MVSGQEKRYRARVIGGEVAEDLFNRGVCLPSGTAMTDGDLDRKFSSRPFLVNQRPNIQAVEVPK